MVDAIRSLTFGTNQTLPYENKKDSEQTKLSEKYIVEHNPPKGFLVPDNYDKGLKALPKTIQASIKGLQGEANDHQLGKMNDAAMATAGVILAGYLASRKAPPKQKLMEFIGIGTFLGVMNLWPKLAFQYPIQMEYGVNIHQQYVDSEGRTKEVFQDPQYTPWDLYSDEDMAYMAEKMGIPNDAYDRDELVRDKAHMLALQANTMWMLTAGVASGIMTPLICHMMETPVGYVAENASISLSNFKLGKIKELKLEDIHSGNYHIGNRSSFKKMEKILQDNKGKILSNKALSDLTNLISQESDKINIDAKFKNAVRKQIENVLQETNKNIEFNAESITNKLVIAQKEIQVAQDKTLNDFVSEIGLDLNKDLKSTANLDEMMSKFTSQANKKGLKEYNGRSVDEVIATIKQNIELLQQGYKTGEKELVSSIVDTMKNGEVVVKFNGKQYKTSDILNTLNIDLNKETFESEDALLKRLKPTDEKFAGLGEALIESNKKTVENRLLTDNVIDKLKNMFKEIDAIRKNEATVNSFINLFVGLERPDSVVANRTASFNNHFFNGLGLNKKSVLDEILQTKDAKKIDPKIKASQVLKKHATTLVTDSNRYEKTIKNLASDMQKLINQKKKYEDSVCVAVNKMISHMSDSEFSELQEKIVGHSFKNNSSAIISGSQEELAGTLKGLYISNFNERIDNTLNYMSKQIMMLDFIKRINSANLEGRFNALSNAKGFSLNFEAVKNKCLEIMLESSGGNAYDQYGINDRNTFKMVEELLFKSSYEKQSDLNVAIKNKNAGYSQILDASTLKSLGGDDSDVTKHLGKVAAQISSQFFNSEKVPDNMRTKDAFSGSNPPIKNIGPKQTSSINPESCADSVLKIAKDKMNTFKWRSWFAGAAIALIALTTFAVAMFGRNNNPEYASKKQSKGVIA